MGEGEAGVGLESGLELLFRAVVVARFVPTIEEAAAADVGVIRGRELGGTSEERVDRRGGRNVE